MSGALARCRPAGVWRVSYTRIAGVLARASAGGRAGGHEPVESGSRAGRSSVPGALQDCSISMGKGVQVGHGAHQTAACVCLVSSMEET